MCPLPLQLLQSRLAVLQFFFCTLYLHPQDFHLLLQRMDLPLAVGRPGSGANIAGRTFGVAAPLEHPTAESAIRQKSRIGSQVGAGNAPQAGCGFLGKPAFRVRNQTGNGVRDGWARNQKAIRILLQQVFHCR